MLHLDVFRPQLNPVLTGRSRPDLVGQTVGGDWVALECKGRVSEPNNQAKNKAKEQAERLVKINGLDPTLNVGGISYFRKDVLRFFWRDPRSDRARIKNPIEVNVVPAAWANYYAPIIDLVRTQPGFAEQPEGEEISIPVRELDVTLGIRADVLRLVEAGLWEDARKTAQKPTEETEGRIYHSDGIRVIAGQSWSLPFKDVGAGLR